jgi:phosphatidylglycerophosphatase (EC 3.1.3.27)
LKNFIIAFILFRIFDFLKPFPIKLLEDIKYFGIVLDDLMAGIYSVLTIKIITN